MQAPHDKSKRSDMERTGLFLDMVGMRAPIPWMDFGTASKLRPEAEKGKQMLGRGPKKMMAKRDWAFDKEERRIFEGDGTFDPVRARHKRNMEQRQKDIGGRWAPPQGRILTNGKNTFYGTFAGRVDAFSAELKGRGPKDPYHPDFVAGAPKFGSYGYARKSKRLFYQRHLSIVSEYVR